HAEELNITAADVGVLARGMTQTASDLVSFGAGASGTAVQLSAASRLNIFGGAASNNRVGFDVRDASSLTVNDLWYEAGTTQFLAPNGSGSFTWAGGRLAGAGGSQLNASSFNGTSTIVNHSASNPIVGGANTLVLGTVGTPGFWSDSSLAWAMWAGRLAQGAGDSSQAPESARTVLDQAGYLRQHLAALRGTRPSDPGALSQGVTNVAI